MNLLHHPQIQLTAVLLISAVFAHGFWHKFRAFDEYIENIAQYQLVPEGLLLFVSRMLMVTEAFIALGILIPSVRTVAAVACMALLIIYIMAITLNLVQGRHHIACGCGGEHTTLSIGLVLRNICLCVAALFTVNTTQAVSLTWQGFCFSVLGAGALGLLYAIWTQLLTNQSLMRRH